MSERTGALVLKHGPTVIELSDPQAIAVFGYLAGHWDHLSSKAAEWDKWEIRVRLAPGTVHATAGCTEVVEGPVQRRVMAGKTLGIAKTPATD